MLEHPAHNTVADVVCPAASQARTYSRVPSDSTRVEQQGKEAEKHPRQTVTCNRYHECRLNCAVMRSASTILTRRDGAAFKLQAGWMMSGVCDGGNLLYSSHLTSRHARVRQSASRPATKPNSRARFSPGWMNAREHDDQQPAHNHNKLDESGACAAAAHLARRLILSPSLTSQQHPRVAIYLACRPLGSFITLSFYSATLSTGLLLFFVAAAAATAAAVVVIEVIISPERSVIVYLTAPFFFTCRLCE